MRARVIVERGGVKRVGDPVEHRLAQLVALRVEQPARLLDQTRHRIALALDAGTEIVGVAPSSEHLVLCLPERVTRFEQLGDPLRLRPDELVDGPRGDRRLAQRGDLGGGSRSPAAFSSLASSPRQGRSCRAAARRGRRRPQADDTLGGDAVRPLLVALALCGCGAAATSAGPVQTTPSPAARAAGGTRTHVAVLLMENEEYGDIIGSSATPFINGLAKRYALATSMYAVSHPSLPNYLALTGGSTFGISSDCTDCNVGAASIVDQLQHAGVSWKAYMEDYPGGCFTGAGAGEFAPQAQPVHLLHARPPLVLADRSAHAAHIR